MTKDEMMLQMHTMANREERDGEAFFTCIALGVIGVSDDLFDSYQDWLRKSNYFEFSNDYSVNVTIGSYDYKGKLKMFKEFLDQYEGEI